MLSLAIETQNMIQMGQGDLEEQEQALTLAMQNRQYYMRQKYPDDQKLARLYDDENTQMQRISSWTKQYAAAANGIISGTASPAPSEIRIPMVPASAKSVGKHASLFLPVSFTRICFVNRNSFSRGIIRILLLHETKKGADPRITLFRYAESV